jgi:tRNA-binding protein
MRVGFSQKSMRKRLLFRRNVNFTKLGLPKIGLICSMEKISFNDFWKVELRVGTIIEANPFPKARKPAYQLRIDFGPELGIKQSSAQLTGLYQPEDLTGRQIIAVTNFPPKQIADFISEVLVLGLEQEGGVVLLQPDREVENGVRVS